MNTLNFLNKLRGTNNKTQPTTTFFWKGGLGCNLEMLPYCNKKFSNDLLCPLIHHFCHTVADFYLVFKCLVNCLFIQITYSKFNTHVKFKTNDRFNHLYVSLKTLRSFLRWYIFIRKPLWERVCRLRFKPLRSTHSVDIWNGSTCTYIHVHKSWKSQRLCYVKTTEQLWSTLI